MVVMNTRISESDDNSGGWQSGCNVLVNIDGGVSAKKDLGKR